MGDFFMSSFIVKQFIMNLNVDNGIKFAKKYNLIFSKEEALIIIPFLKKNINYVDKEHKEKLLSLIKKEVSNVTYNKVVILVDKLIK